MNLTWDFIHNISFMIEKNVYCVRKGLKYVSLMLKITVYFSTWAGIKVLIQKLMHIQTVIKYKCVTYIQESLPRYNTDKKWLINLKNFHLKISIILKNSLFPRKNVLWFMAILSSVF